MLNQEVYQGIRKNYVLKPIPPEKWLNPNDIDWCAEKLLGKGTYGRVVKGTWLGKPSAIKIANTDHGQEATDLLKEECSLMSNLDHPNIVKVYGCCDKNGSFVMVMELLHSSLSNLLESYRPSSRSKKSTPSKVRKNLRVPIWKILRDVAAGIEYLHGLDLIHRDVKPSNILLSRSTFQAKLCDFGLARKFEAGNNSSMTDAGTSPYKAPEVNYGLGRYDRSVDIFSLGRVIERDLCPLLRDENLKQLADYCTQSIGTEHLSFKSPSSRPSAAQVLDRIKEHIRKYRPGRVVLSLDPEEIERVKMKMQNVKRVHDEDTEGNKGASLAGSDKGMDVDESLGTECNDTSKTAQNLSSQRTRKTKNVKESKVLADDQQVEKRELRNRSKKPLPGSGLQFCAPGAQKLDSHYCKTSSMKLRLRCADKKKRVAMKRETHCQEKIPSKKSDSNRSDASDFVYVTSRSKGGKYHLERGHSTAHLMINLKMALELGKAPCSDCCVCDVSKKVNARKRGRNTATPSKNNASIHNSIDDTGVPLKKRCKSRLDVAMSIDSSDELSDQEEVLTSGKRNVASSRSATTDKIGKVFATSNSHHNGSRQMPPRLCRRMTLPILPKKKEECRYSIDCKPPSCKLNDLVYVTAVPYRKNIYHLVSGHYGACNPITLKAAKAEGRELCRRCMMNESKP